MQTEFWFRGSRLTLSATLFALSVLAALAQHPSRGLWVGEVTLTNVNEVSVAVNAQNVVVAPNPTNATPTSSAAHLRLILHVDGGGQVRLLKAVAVINKSTNEVPDIALVTDESLYPLFPSAAKRIASAVFDFGDLRAYQAVTNVASAVAGAAAGAAGSPPSSNSIYSAAVTAAYRAATNAALPGGQVSTNYAGFVASTAFKVAATNAALAATRAAFETASATGSTLLEIRNAASSAALQALGSLLAASDAFVLSTVEMQGSLTPGGALNGQFFLGARHPTNPFRHFRHPDHTVGYNLVRSVRLDVSPPPSGSAFEPGGFGVDRLQGAYREEIHGLHKPLGPNRNVGLRAEGAFVLNRLSLVDTLNR